MCLIGSVWFDEHITIHYALITGSQVCHTDFHPELGESARSGVYVMGKSWTATGKRIIGISLFPLVSGQSWSFRVLVMVVDNKSKHRQQYLIPKRTSSTLQGGQYQLQVKAAVITIKPINTQALLKEKTPIFDSPEHSCCSCQLVCFSQLLGCKSVLATGELNQLSF